MASDQLTRPTVVKELVRLDPQALIAQAVTSGAAVETLERLVALAKDVRQEQARAAWYEAMAQFQADCPPIVKKTRGQAGTAIFKYTKLDDIMDIIRPVMGPLGLSVAWKTDVRDNHAVALCRVSHELGHTEESGEVKIPVSVSADGKGASPAQRVGAALSYAQRYALKAVLGITPSDDEDEDSGGDRQPKVAMPQAKPAPVVDEPPHPADEQPPLREVADGNLEWVGVPVAVTQKETRTGGKRYGIKGVGNDGADVWYNTFSSSIGLAAIGAKNGKEAVKIEYRENPPYGNDIIRLHTHDRTFEADSK